MKTNDSDIPAIFINSREDSYSPNFTRTDSRSTLSSRGSNPSTPKANNVTVLKVVTPKISKLK